MTQKRIQGLTVFESLTDLDPTLVAEAEVDVRFLPPLGAGERYEHKQVRREARAARREENPFFRFVSSGMGAVCISLVVAFALIAGIVYFVNYGPNAPVSGPGETPGGTPGGSPGTEAATWGEGKIPTGEIDASYTVYTDKRVYETPPSHIILTLRGKYPGVDIAYFQSAYIESLTDPDYVVESYHNDLAEERTEPLGKDEYAVWTKTIDINEANKGSLPDGIYRIHHMEYDREQGKYISAAFYDFAVGKAYGEILESGITNRLPNIVTEVDQTSSLLNAFFAADRSALTDGNLSSEITRENLYHITPAGLYEATGVRVFKEAVYSHSFLLYDGKLYDIPSLGGNGFHNAMVCDYDRNGQDDVLFTCSWGSGMHRSEVWVFNTRTREFLKIFDTSTYDFAAHGFTGDLTQANLCVTRTPENPATEDPVFTIAAARVERGEHGFADLQFCDVRPLFTVEPTAGGLPQIHALPQPNEPTEPAGPTDPDTTYPEAAEKPYTITASISKNAAGDRAFLSVKYTASAPGTGLSPIFEIAVRKLSGPENPEGLALMTTAEAIEVLPPEADVYATYTRTWTITNPEVLLSGVYRVYALNYKGECIDSADVVWSAETSSGESLPDLTTTADRDPAHLDAFFAADLSNLPDGEIIPTKIWHITPAGLYEATGVRIYKNEACASFFLLDGKAYQAGTFFGGYGLHNAVVCDYDLNGVNDILFTCSTAMESAHSMVWVFNTETRMSHKIFDTADVSDADIRLCVAREEPAGLTGRPTFRIFIADARKGEHGYADMGWTNLDYFGEILQTEGKVPTLRVDAVIEEETEPPAPPVETTPAFADVDYHITSVDMTPMNDGTVKLTVSYSADEPGVTVWCPSTDFRMEMIDDGPHPEELLVCSTEEAIEYVLPTEKNGGFAVWSKSHTVENPEALIHGTYRITALTWAGAVIDTFDFQWDGQSATPTGLIPK